MMERHRMGRSLLTAAALCCFLAPNAAAATITGYMQFNGAFELWNLTTTGLTAIGQPVMATTLPKEMTDPAKVQLYAPAGVLMAEYRNYRPEPDGYISMNSFKQNIQDHEGLVAWNLAVMGPASGTLQEWGQTIGATDVLGPPAYPDYGNVGTHWFAQTTVDGIPTWWCEAQADALGTFNTDPKRFLDFVVLEFDDAALNPDGTVSLWIGGVVTGDLDGLIVDDASYAVLEGRMTRTVWRDDDGDGYFVGAGVRPAQTDCCDDPNGPCFARGMGVIAYTQDPPICDTCVCGVKECAPCARCIHPGGLEFAGDRIDSNCNGPDNGGGCPLTAASMGTEMERKLGTLRVFRDRHLMGSDRGRALAAFYHRSGPAASVYLMEHPGLGRVVRSLIPPLVGFSWLVTARSVDLASPAEAALPEASVAGLPIAGPREAWPTVEEQDEGIAAVDAEPAGTGSSWGQSLFTVPPSI